MRQNIFSKTLPMLTLFSLSILSSSSAFAIGYVVTVDTSAVAGTSGYLDFQFNPGNATSQPATAVISNFTSNGGAFVGAPSITGDASGLLPGPLTFDNLAALNEYFHQFTYGTKFSFTLTLSGPAISSPNGIATAGTTFGVGLYDSGQNPILTNQGAGTGFAGEVDINLDGSLTATGFPTAGAGPSVVTFSLANSSEYQLRYMSNLNIGDSYINVTNAGTLNGFDPTGRICVNAYTFDPAEELISCCTCPVTPNGLSSLSARNDLISNTLTPGVPTSIVVKLVATAPVNGTCNAAGIVAANLVRGMRAWGTTIHALPGTPTKYGTTETPFSTVELSVSELAKLTSFCGFIQANGSGFGVCKSCRAGALGSDNK